MTRKYISLPNEPILVTGASGFIGAKVVEILLEYGFHNIRCFVRPSSQLGRLKKTLGQFNGRGNVELIVGDLVSRDDCQRACKEAAVILHLAAGMEKSFAGAFMNSALATRNLIEAFMKHGSPRRFVNVSSFAVYSNLALKRDALLDETCPLEDSPQERFDAYGFGKLKQEQLVKEYGEREKLPYVIVRPGAVFGPGKQELSGRIGINTFGFFIHLGGRNRLPLTFVDNCALAIVLAGITPGVDREIFNVVDDDLLTSKAFLLWEKYSVLSKNQLPPVFNRRRCAAEWKGNFYSNDKLKQRLGWSPRVNIKDAMAAFLNQFEPGNSSQCFV